MRITARDVDFDENGKCHSEYGASVDFISLDIKKQNDKANKEDKEKRPVMEINE